MTAKTMAHTYARLSRDERFRLILAAWGRGDTAEIGSLARTAPRYRITDIAPYMMAFKTLSFLTYIGLLDLAARCESAWLAANAVSENDDKFAQLARIAQVHGYRFRMKWRAWVDFCNEWLVPPRLLWGQLPGFDRIDSIIATEDADPCSHEEFLSIVNELRPKEWPPFTTNSVTVASAVADLQQLFEYQVVNLSP
jgi:hypothetical protein